MRFRIKPIIYLQTDLAPELAFAGALFRRILLLLSSLPNGILWVVDGNVSPVEHPS